MIHVRRIARELTVPSSHVARANGAIQDVWVILREILKFRFWNTEILCEDRFWGFGNPVVEVEGGPAKGI